MSKKHKGAKPKELAREKAKVAKATAHAPEIEEKQLEAKHEEKSGVMASMKSAGASMMETLKNPQGLVNAVRDHVTHAADAVDRTLEAVKTALENADEHVAKAQDWTAEKVQRVEGTLTKVRETVAAGVHLVDATQVQARALSESADKVLKESGEAAQATADGLQGKNLPEAAIDAGRDEVLAPETGTPINADLDIQQSANEEDPLLRRTGSDVRNGGSDLI